MNNLLKKQRTEHPDGGKTLSTAAGQRGFRAVLARPSTSANPVTGEAQAHVDWHHDDHQNSHSDGRVKN